MTERQPSAHESMSASVHEVRALNILAASLLQNGYNQPIFGQQIKQVAFALPGESGELRLRRMLDSHDSSDSEDLMRLQATWLEETPEMGDVWHVIDVETAGDNPDAIDAYEGVVELDPQLEIARFTDNFEAHSLAQTDPDNALDLFGELFALQHADLKSVTYTSEFHARVMALLHSVKGTYKPPQL